MKESTRKRLLERTGNKCAHCGKGLDLSTMTVEHIIPKHKGGLDDEWNLTALCERCNFEKANFLYSMNWYGHIEDKFKGKYREYHDKKMAEARKDKILIHEPSIFGYIPESVKALMAKKGKPIKASTMKNMVGKVEFRKAFPGEAKEIHTFIQKCINHPGFYLDTTYYNNEYRILEAVRQGYAFVGTDKSGICVAAFLMDAKEMMIPPQVTNTAESLGLEVKYIVMDSYCLRPVVEVSRAIDRYIELRLLTMGILPVSMSSCTDPAFMEGNMQFPYTHEDFSGTLFAPTPSSVKEIVINEMNDTLFRGCEEEISQDDYERFAEIWLKGEVDDYDAEFLNANPNLLNAYNLPKQELIERGELLYFIMK